MTIKLIVGLANPGSVYHETRHNVGSWFVEALAATHGQNLKLEKKFSAKIAKLSNGVWLLEPTTYMNLSGQAVKAFSHFYKIAPEEILVCHDELDLQPGIVKLKEKGGHGGHNGLRDIINKLGGSQFIRLRFGIGHPGDKSKVQNYVLKAPSQEDKISIITAIDKALNISDELFAGNLQKAMLVLHT